MALKLGYNVGDLPEDLPTSERREIIKKMIYYLDYPRRLEHDSHLDNDNSGSGDTGGYRYKSRQTRRSRRSRRSRRFK